MQLRGTGGDGAHVAGAGLGCAGQAQAAAYPGASRVTLISALLAPLITQLPVPIRSPHFSVTLNICD